MVACVHMSQNSSEPASASAMFRGVDGCIKFFGLLFVDPAGTVGTGEMMMGDRVREHDRLWQSKPMRMCEH
jgi:hypothetical protein